MLSLRLEVSLFCSCSVVSDSLRPHGLQHARLPCTSLSPGVCSNSSPLSQWCRPAILSSVACPLLLLPPIFYSIRIFSNESVWIKWPKYWSFSFSIGPFSEYSGLIFFRIEWFDLSVHGTLKSLLQHHSLKASSIFGTQSFLIVQLSHPHMTTGKTIALIRQTLSAQHVLCFL